MINSNYFHVSIPVPVLAQNAVLPVVPLPSSSYYHSTHDRDLLSEEFLDWLESKQLQPRQRCYFLLFYAHKGGYTSVHKDSPHANAWALNIVLGDAKIQMCWHDVVEGQANTATSKDLEYTKYSRLSPIVDKVTLSTTVVNISVPHSSFNLDKGSWVISMRMRPFLVDMPTLHQQFKS